MDTPDALASQMQDPTPADEAFVPTLDLELATVSVVDGIWQDQPDNVAAFVEARLGDLARGRGNLYVCLDVSGEVEGRSDLERALVEVIRDTYATSRGSISFALAEALRAANTHVYESNRQIAREQRRMVGVSAVVLRGTDLYIAQSGPAVVYVEANEKLLRYPAESDWFVEDAPLISPQGTASAPLGIRREFASDLAHIAVRAGDVFVLATRALTQLASTEDLAIAFTERSAQEISSYLEDLGEDADFTALIAELTDPRTPVIIEDDDLADEPPQAPHIESLPIPLTSLAPLDDSEPPLESVQEEQVLDWSSPDEEANPQRGAPEYKHEPVLAEPVVPNKNAPQPVYAAAAVLPALSSAPFAPAPPPPGPPSEAELERRRAERAARRAAQKEGAVPAAGETLSSLLVGIAAIGGIFASIFGIVNWDRLGARINRTLNLAIGGLISLILLVVRLILPGTPGRSTAILPRRATSDPVWLKALALMLPILFIALAGARYYQTINARGTQINALIADADTIVKQAEVNPDRTLARTQLNEALQIITDARTIQDSSRARAVLYRIQDQLNEIDGVAVLYNLPTIADLGSGALISHIAASDQDIFLLDERGRIYQYIVNDVTGESKPATPDGVLLKTGDTVGEVPVSALKLTASATRAQDKAAIVAVTDDALLTYDLEAQQWTAQKVSDAGSWGDLKAIAAFGGNVYLLDSKNSQVYKYTPTETGFADTSVPYFPENSQPRLSRAVDMAIDGDVWVLNDNGTVQRFRAGTPIDFTLQVLPTPLKDPVAIFTQPEVDSLYVADAGNQRIVEFDKNGKFVRQFKPYAEKGDVFKELQDFTVNETKRKMYFTNTHAAYITNVPKEMTELILGIETSCDETAAAVVENGCRILSNVVASQAEMHARYGGVYPEVASREHVLKIVPVIETAMENANATWTDLSAVAVTNGPGLAGSLLVGVNTAKGIALGQNLPLLGTNHLEGHVYANWLASDIPYLSDTGIAGGSVEPPGGEIFPLVALVVSGGHSSLVLMQGHGKYLELGHTIDDAAGEAFDKIARLLNLGYPGGPTIQRAAKLGDPKAFVLPRAQTRNPYDFSFSGLKTAVLNLVKRFGDSPLPVNDIAASAQVAIIDALVDKTVLAVEEFNAKLVLLAGGVAANSLLRDEMSARAARPVVFPPPKLCVDNAAMISAAAWRHYREGERSTWDLDVVPNLKLV